MTDIVTSSLASITVTVIILVIIAAILSIMGFKKASDDSWRWVGQFLSGRFLIILLIFYTLASFLFQALAKKYEILNFWYDFYYPKVSDITNWMQPMAQFYLVSNITIIFFATIFYFYNKKQ